MSKQTKILISVVLSCTMLLLLFIPSFASPPISSLNTINLTRASGGTRSFTIDLNRPIIDESKEAPIPDFLEVGYSLIVPCECYVFVEGSGQSDNPKGIIIQRESEFVVNFYFANDSLDGPDGISFLDYTVDPSTGTTVVQGFYPILTVATADGSADYRVVEYLTSIFNGSDFNSNPFVETMELIVEALDVPLFGTFSIWDMLTTICGLFAVVWLLKLLAGG